MKKRVTLFFLVSLLTLCSSTLLAQQTAAKNLDVGISANLTGSIKTIKMQPLNLEGAQQNDDIIKIDPRSSQYAGKVVAIGNPSTKISINYLKYKELKQQNGSSTLTFTYSVAWNKQDNQNTAHKLVKENRKFQFNENGQFYLWIGGQANTSSVTPGDYVGEFSLDIEYY